MRSLPRTAQVFIALIWLLGGLALAGAVLFPRPISSAERWELVLFVLLGVLAGRIKVRARPAQQRRANEASIMTLGSLFTFAALLRFGPAAAVLVGVVGTLSSCVLPKRMAPYQTAFNIAQIAFVAFFAGMVFVILNGGTLVLHPLRSFPAVMISCACFFLLDTGGVAAVIALCSGQKVIPLWKETFGWTAPSYFASAGASALAILVLGPHVGTVLLYVLPVAYLVSQAYALHAARADEKQQRLDEERQHAEALQLSHAQLADLYLATIQSLALAIDAKDQYTHQHILRVQRYAVAIARQMHLTGPDLEGLSTGALLHDIGKLGVPEYVLLKPGPLSADEFAKIKKHPEIGAAILDPVAFPWPVLPVVKHHHERWDGTGYPEGLSGEAIPLTARILAVADVYDALTSARPYRGAWSHDKALASIRQEANAHFDPAAVDAFLAVVEEIVRDMARNGYGPLAATPDTPNLTITKADEAVRDIQRASSELWALYEVAQTLSSSLGLSETLDILARKLEAILPGTACLFLLQEEQGDALVARAYVGINREFFEGSRTRSAAGTSLGVATTRQAYRGVYDEDDLFLTNNASASWVSLQSALIVPVVHQGNVLGTMNVYHPQPNAFGLHDQQLLETIAEHAATAIGNAILFDRTRSHANTDALTGLYNVRYLTQYVDERCQKAAVPSDVLHQHDRDETLRKDDLFALLCLDLDSFKPINDLFGHQKGDQVLRDLSQLFRVTVRKNDIVARYGGDEFLIVLDRVGPQEAEAVAQKLQEAVADYDPELFHAQLGALRIGVSAGVGCFPHDGSNYAALLRAADAKMYQQKTVRKLRQLTDSPKPDTAPEEPAQDNVLFHPARTANTGRSKPGL